MSKIRLVSLFIIAILPVALWASPGAETSQPAGKSSLDITAISRWNANPVWAPTDTTLRRLVDAAADKYVGRDVTVEWGNYPDDPHNPFVPFLQMREAAGNLPDLLLLDNMMYNAESMEYAISKGLIREITRADLDTYMKGYVARFQQCGTDVSFAMSDNTKYTGQAGLGKLWYIPYQLSPGAFPASKVPNGFVKPSPGGFTGGLFRDDLLKRVFPSARTEAEFRTLLVDKKGQLTLQDMVDVPIRSWEDLYNYGKRVQALNVRVGEKPVIPLGGILGSSESAGSYFWSQTSATGYFFKGSFWWLDSQQLLKATASSQELREQGRWMNRLYNEGLLDPEIFVMRNDQYFAKAGNGEYGVIAWWFVPKDNAIKLGRERGYGWRPVPFFYPIDMTRNNNKYQRVSFTSTGIFLSNRIDAADWGDTLRYIDYFMTEASDDLAYWGDPSSYTGSGLNRKYKPEYKALEDWAVFGKEGPRDGTYFGLGGAAPINMAEGAHMQYEVKPVGFFQTSGNTYPWAPYWSYRASPAWDPRGELESADLLNWVSAWWRDNFVHPNTLYYRVNKNWDFNSYATGSDAAKTYNSKRDSPTVNGLIGRAITRSASDFDRNWDMYVQYLKDAGLDAWEADTREALRANWESNILQSIIK